jgi:hypothetical protein
LSPYWKKIIISNVIMGLSINMNIMRKRNLVLSLILAIFLLAPVTHAQAVSSGLTFGTKGSQVATLQQKLQDAGFYEYPNITGFFGAATKQAVIYFQNAYADIILTPLHLTEGTGYVGSLTATVLDGLTANPGTSNTGAPELSLRLSHTTIYVGYGSTIFWHSTNATACVGSNGWSGTFNPSTTKAVFPITSTYYTLTCGNGMASTTKSCDRVRNSCARATRDISTSSNATTTCTSGNTTGGHHDSTHSNDYATRNTTCTSIAFDNWLLLCRFRERRRY